LLASSAASAEPPPAQDERWYGLQVAMADAGALGLAMQGVARHEPGMTWGAFGVYASGAPIVHGTNGRPLWAVASLGLRLAVPYAFGRIFSGAEPPGPGPCGGLSCTNRPSPGATVGAILVSIADTALARSATAPEHIDPMANGWSVAPLLLASRDWTLVGVGGTFR
jgi:hypothetical protein